MKTGAKINLKIFSMFIGVQILPAVLFIIYAFIFLIEDINKYGGVDKIPQYTSIVLWATIIVNILITILAFKMMYKNRNIAYLFSYPSEKLDKFREKKNLKSVKPVKDLKTILKYGFFGFLAVLLAQTLAGVVMTPFIGTETTSENTEDIMAYILKNPFIIIMVVVSAPVLEELFFRRFIFKYFLKYGFFISATISGLLFALAHFDFTFILTYLASAYVFSYIYYKTQNLWVNIISHSLLNAFVVISQLALIYGLIK